jgi:Putative beta-barrel porin-2, OmpL-like. bbp2
MRLNLTALALALLVPMTAFAQDPAPAPEAPADPSAQPPPPPPPPPPMDQAPPPPPMDMPPPASAPLDTATGPAPASAPNLKWEGLVDSYYLYKFTGDNSLEDPELRAFDTLGNNFTLAYAKLAVQLDADPVGFRMDFGYGQVGAIINNVSQTFSDATPTANAERLYNSAFIVQQAYATARWGIVTLDAGKFNTTAGAEVTESNKNWLYSRSFLFNGIPALHTGLRLTLKPTDMISIQGAVVNGGVTNNDPDNNSFKTIGLSLGITPPDTGTSIALTSYIGKEGMQGDQGDVTFLIDLVASQSLGDTFGLNLNVDYFKLGEELWWWGASLMGRLTLTDMLYLALRGEYVMGKNGGYGSFMFEDLSLFEGTLMLGLPMGANYEIRLEVRGDFASEDILHKGTELKSNQVTGLAAFLAYF